MSLRSQRKEDMNTANQLSRRSAIVFDFDGTLADTKEGIISTATTVLTEWGIAPEELSRVGELIGPPFPQAYEQVFGLSHEDAVEVTERYRRIYTKRGVEAWPAFPGIPELLEELQRAGRRLVVASSKRENLVRRGLDDNGLTGFFDSIRAKGTDEESTKTDAILAGLAELGVTPADAVMVGDRHHDVEAAAACGVPCIGVLYGNTADEAELVDAGAAAIAHTVAELRALLVESQGMQEGKLL